MKMPNSAEETTSFQEGLFILFLFETEEPASKRRKKERKMKWHLLRPINTAKSIPFCYSLPSPPQHGINAKETITNSPAIAGLLVS
jgi:hypothetical protein